MKRQRWEPPSRTTEVAVAAAAATRRSRTGGICRATALVGGAGPRAGVAVVVIMWVATKICPARSQITNSPPLTSRGLLVSLLPLVMLLLSGAAAGSSEVRGGKRPFLRDDAVEASDAANRREEFVFWA